MLRVCTTLAPLTLRGIWAKEPPHTAMLVILQTDWLVGQTASRPVPWIATRRRKGDEKSMAQWDEEDLKYAPSITVHQHSMGSDTVPIIRKALEGV